MTKAGPATTLVDLIRHGEPVGGSRYRGQIDDPLSDKGWQQMRAAVGEAKPWQQIVTSSLSRCRAFAEELAVKHGLPVDVEKRFVEIGFGHWEGKTKAEIVADNPDALSNFLLDPVKHRPPGAESLEEFRDRIVPAWDAMLEKHQGKHILVIGHAGMMRMIMANVLEMPPASMYRINVPNAGITRIQVEHRHGRHHPNLLFHAGPLR